MVKASFFCSFIQSKPLEVGTEQLQQQRDGQCFLHHSVHLLFTQGKENAFNNSKGNTFTTAFILLLQLSSIVCHQQEFGCDFTLAHSSKYASQNQTSC